MFLEPCYVGTIPKYLFKLLKGKSFKIMICLALFYKLKYLYINLSDMKVLIICFVLFAGACCLNSQTDITHMIDSLNRPYRIEFDKKDSFELSKIARWVEIRDSVERQIVESLDSFITNEANYCTVMELVDVVIKQNYLKDPYAFFLDRAYIGKSNGFCELSTEHIWIQAYPIFYYLAGKFPTETVEYLSN